MPDQGSAADEHAILAEITAPLSRLTDDPLPIVTDVDFPVALRGYDRMAVDAYVKRTGQLIGELQATRSPEAAVRRALERVGEQISGILQRAHETSEQITAQSRREAEERLDGARAEAEEIVAGAHRRVRELDGDADRIWAERFRIIEDARALAGQLSRLADDAAERFPPAEAGAEPAAEESGSGTAPFDVEGAAAATDGEPDPSSGGAPAESGHFDGEEAGHVDREEIGHIDPGEIGHVDPHATAVMPAAEEPGTPEDPSPRLR